ncbi:hypothetical protein CS063_01585 [Sporanaerobium hydrogeniformans]|uniref:Uncharacterized protein n=1 Tax=Sporanaerobium hydrogeniformans TaxID=3072179 RepID=A0AC61DH06_9FIRM|nr:hypothetical protein [Sporanaerobium hydrogeniformans]PHV72192.1 hypothetical protein CS063_01585 [Sporanaerobium hydrogeniformans]
MANYTTNYNLKKPLGTENYNIEDQNGNMDIIDQKLGEQAEQISGCLEKMGPLTGLMTSVKTNIVAAINSLCTLASTTVNGLMSKEDKNKLDGIAIGANNYVHPGSGTNPHGTTKADVGLGSVLNYGVATTAEAQVATSNVKYMTPALVKTLLQYQVQNGGVSMIKSVQRGVVAAGTASGTTVAIASVNISKAVVILSSSYGGTSKAPAHAELTSSTSLSVYAANVSENDLYWQVLEFY